LKTTLQKILTKKINLREARYGIARSTLFDKVKCVKSGQEITLQSKPDRFTNTFPPEYEEKLINHVKNLANRCLSLMKKKFLKLAYNLAVELNLLHRFNTEKEMICLENNEKDWIQYSSCQKWAHEACADISECSDNYICDRKLY